MNYVTELNADNQREIFEKLHQCQWEDSTIMNEDFVFVKRKQFFADIDDVEKFDLIYFDAFGYDVQPELWSTSIFKKMFDVDKFTSQSWGDKLQDGPGLKALAAQTALDLGVLTAIYLPTFYIFKASVFSGSLDPSVWFQSGVSNYQMNFVKDEFDLIRVWLPADLVCFSVPLYLRLPVRHVVSFVWTAYLSFSRGGH